MYRVLIVEDEDVLRRILTRNLALRGYSVAEAATVAEADDALAVSTEPFDLILLDINLPDQTGWDVLRHMAAQAMPSTPQGDVSPQPKVIIMTAVRPVQCRIDQFHPAAVLIKPFPIGTLLRLIERVLARPLHSATSAGAMEFR